MPRISKNDKIRNDTLKELNSIRTKLNKRTYTAYVNSIREKRIDAVKRLGEKFIDLKNSQDKNITKKSFQQSLDKTTEIPKMLNYNKTGQDTTFNNLTPRKLRKLFENFDVRKKSIMQVGNQFTTLTPAFVKELLNNVEGLWVVEDKSFGGARPSDAEVIQEIKEVDSFTIRKSKWMGKDHNEGAFFPYYSKLNIDLSDFQIYNSKPKNYKDNCFVYAMLQSGKLNEKEMFQLRSICIGIYLPTNQLKKIAEKFKLFIRIKPIDNIKQMTKNYGNKKDKEVNIGLIGKHYFYIKPVEFTSYSIKNYFNINNNKDWNEICKITDKQIYKEKRYIDSFKLIKILYENKDTHLELIPYEHILDTQYYDQAKEILDLHYTENAVKLNEKKEIKKEEETKVVYFDFETFTDEEKHIAYMVSSSETETFFGEECGLQFLKKLYKLFFGKTIILIAHNCGYDFRFIQKYLTMESLCERGHSLLQAKAKFYPGFNNPPLDIILKDSYSVITMPLAKFGKCFNIPQGKEILPYNLYNRVNIKKRFIHKDICKVACDFQVECNMIGKTIVKEDKEDYYRKFIKNCFDWNCINGEYIDIIIYSEMYCKIDVEVLKLGYEKFGSLLKEACNLNVIDFMSSAQLANYYYLENGVYEGVYQLSGKPLDYIMKCMVGGRTMCAYNKSNHILNKILQDFDAVSLYNSSQYRLKGFLNGKPKVLENLSYDFLKKCDGYFVQIKIIKNNKKRAFPLMSYKNENGIRMFENEVPGNIYVCKFELEDLIEFHNIEFEIIDGYYYDEGRNNKLEEICNHLFNERLKMKAIKNPLQEIYKLIMNSSYGKTLQKAHPENIVFKNENNIDAFVDKNYNSVKNYREIECDNGFKKYIVKTEKGINEHFNNVACGVEILAMSKRIMNEVMCLAEDNKIDIYYQDTDSMHIQEKDIPKLEELFMEKYNRELIGKGMGQFHSDFDSDIIKKNIKATESIFLGKKCYIDKLEGEDEEGNNVIDYHIRMKGVSNKAILHKAKKEVRTFLDIYKSLYKHNKEMFDLCCGGKKINFKFNGDYTISTVKAFERTLHFK